MIKHFRSDDNLSEAVAEIRRNGVVIVDDVFTPAVMDTLLGLVSNDLNAQSPGGGKFFGNKKRSVNGLLRLGRINTLFQDSAKYRHPWGVAFNPLFPRLHPRVE